jgi:Fuc2NAc and GlcNAc transferase
MHKLLLFVVIIATYFLVYILKFISEKKSIYDHPNFRSSHSVPIPRTGGIGIIMIWYIYLFYLLIFDSDFDIMLMYILLLCIPISIISIIDDFVNIEAKTRFIIQIFSVGIASWIIVNNFYSNQLISIIFTSAIIVLGGTWFINLYNFMDGIDSFASLQAITYFFITFMITKQDFLLILIGILLGFLIWNWPPAKIFMGDSGSTMLGYTIFFFGLYFHFIGKQHLFITLAFTSFFWFDSSITLARRFLSKEKLTEAHRKHAYQRLIISGFKHIHVSVAMLFTYSIIATIYIAFYSYRYIAFVVFIASIVLNIIYYIWVEQRKSFS